MSDKKEILDLLCPGKLLPLEHPTRDDLYALVCEPNDLRVLFAIANLSSKVSAAIKDRLPDDQPPYLSASYDDIKLFFSFRLWASLCDIRKERGEAFFGEPV